MESNRSLFVSSILMALTGLFLIVYAGYQYLNTTIIITWETATEFETIGYAIYRSSSVDGDYEKISADLIPASPDPLTGGAYEFVDEDVRAGKTYFYKLEEIEASGLTTLEGPIEAQAASAGIAETVLGVVLLVFAWYTNRIAKRAKESLPE